MRYATVLVTAVALLAAMGGCEVERPESGPARSDAPGARDEAAGPPGPAAAETPPSGPASRGGRRNAAIEAARRRLPAELLVREGACPFECCIYREWTAPVALPLHAADAATAPIVDTIPAGTRFDTLGGRVRITGIQIVVVADTLNEYGERREDLRAPERAAWTPALFPGDTLVLLDYVGEGYYHAWRDGVVFQPAKFWVPEAEWERDGVAPGFSIGEHATEWWVEARTVAGTVGWFRHPGEYVPGSDRCAVE